MLRIMIQITDLRKSFNGQPVLQGVNLEVTDGESLTIIGRSGCGKSVLLKHILGLIKPDGGDIVIDGEEITNIDYRNLARIRRKFGILFQGAALFDSMTVRENISLPLEEHTNLPNAEIDRWVERAMKMVELPPTALDLKPSELSGGMKKRVGLARALIYEPQYMLYDEPTTGLDPIMADIINTLIVDLQRKLSMTSVIVTHDITSAFRVSDRIVMLHYGKIIFSGTPEQTSETSNPTVRQFIEGSAEGPIKPVHRNHILER